MLLLILIAIAVVRFFPISIILMPEESQTIWGTQPIGSHTTEDTVSCGKKWNAVDTLA